jgi:RHS repeat-associated protein
MAEQHSQTADYDNRWKFTGHELDRETGLYYAGARYYDPKVSIWLSVDPLAEEFPNFNPYNYVMQNPINLTDPTGMCPDEGSGSEPLKNVIIYITSFENKELYQKNGNKKDGWDILYAVDIVDGYNQVNEKYGENSIDNLVLRSHGLDEGKLDIGGVVASEGGGSPEKVKFDNFGLSYFENMSKDEFLSEGFTEKEYNNYTSFISLSTKIKNGGNMIFSGCLVGKNDLFTDRITRMFGSGKNINFFFNVGLGGINLGNYNDSIKYEDSPEKILFYNSTGQKSYVNDVILNNNSNNPLTIKK